MKTDSRGNVREPKRRTTWTPLTLPQSMSVTVEGGVMARFRLVVIEAPDSELTAGGVRVTPRTTTTIEGREKAAEHLTLGDMEKVVEVEQFLERLLGHRFHLELEQGAADAAPV